MARAKETPLLRLDELHIELPTRQGMRAVLEGVSLSVGWGEIVGIVGESGCGKSITAQAVMGLLPAGARIAGGTIGYDSAELTQLSPEAMRRLRGREIAMVFQDPMTSLNPVFTVGEQLMEGPRLHLAMSRKDAYNHSVGMLEKVGLSRAEQLMREYPHRLSGGMRQRVMIAMALACRPKLLIADEPTTALDVTVQAQILELLRDLNRTEGTSVLLISHDLGVISEMCSRVSVMYAGQVAETAPAAELFRSPAHPYTAGLLRSIPSPDKRGEPLYAIPGRVPPPEERAGGCPFSARCDRAVAACSGVKPAGRMIADRHEVRCLLAEERRPSVREYQFA
ncbi:ABC transporter ATP-binding protein [Paenibacillus ehimensis]|uniref:ABC transporter ATP-binding protein n=1 Tax=Paenibacillus ehimensis TaxID=79264 RepID=A0ABT8V420_9BACL|nr:ABC transporter ATP-binding protein [Paenibacillus ehimensis]MDO3675483.1 ABC transporter ATP-binding protein [Paenibacillus ehimensis]